MKDKIHPHLLLAAGQALEEIFFKGLHAEKVVERFLFQNKKWGARDRRFFAETVYECVRWWRRLGWLLDKEERPEECLSIVLAWREWRTEDGQEVEKLLGTSRGIRLNIDWQILRAKLKQEPPMVVAESIPDWLNEWGFAGYSERWPALLRHLNTKAPVDLRVNTLKARVEDVILRMQAEGIETLSTSKSLPTLTLPERKNVFASQAYKDGLFEVQDRGSQILGLLLPVEPGQRVIDACAGAGGKTLQLAARMENKGKIIAMDIHEWKLQELRKRASRAGASIIETRFIENSKTVKRLEESADAVLLDVPCSGLGVLRRHPDSKWKLSPDEILQHNQTQSDILRRYSKMVKPGGYLVYATCSIFKSENQDIVQSFLAEETTEGRSSWSQESELIVDPVECASDGFFGCLLRKSR
jgi:16S rRNA (cytosine967-C5)-methyltransferase